MNQEITDFLEALEKAEKVLIGIGGEWRQEENGPLTEDSGRNLREAYGALYRLVEDKDYYVVTTLTDGALYDTAFDTDRVVAPCGNVHWRQCSRACTKDIWEEEEAPDDRCPHCGAPLTGNTIEAETYIEEGYLPRWEAYKKWQTGTLNRSLLILELGEGFKIPTVMRWPFEKITFFNQKAAFFRINENFYQIPKEVEDRAAGVKENSVDFVRAAEKARKPKEKSEVE